MNTRLTPDEIVYWSSGSFAINATIAFTWGVMVLVATLSWLATRRLSSDERPSRRQLLLEILVIGMRDQLAQIMPRHADRYLPFVGTLFLFIGASNTLMIVPGYEPPTASLSTTAALALSVFLAVPAFGIMERGLGGYLKSYIRPSPFMLPFHLIGELSRTLSLAVRLAGNIMSGGKIVGILVAIAPLLFPIVMEALGLLTGLVQAYIFAVLAAVYIAAATVGENGSAGTDSQHASGRERTM
ncbi:MAG: F0F1 ATP synthase subunit A [Phycisphaerales bacterium]|nr:F0F1 ATP synthase subunit A [Phycisphaerales bacterium]